MEIERIMGATLRPTAGGVRGNIADRGSRSASTGLAGAGLGVDICLNFKP